MRIDVTREIVGDVLVITMISKDANLAKSEQFQRFIFGEIEKGHKKIVISFENVDYLDSSFLGALVSILKQLVPHEGKLVLVELNNDIQNLFELTRLDKIFTLRNSVDTALKEL